MLGWLPAETPGDDREAGLNDFVQNRACAPSVSVVSRVLRCSPPFFAQLASCRSSTWQHRADSRRPLTTSRPWVRSNWARAVHPRPCSTHNIRYPRQCPQYHQCPCVIPIPLHPHSPHPRRCHRRLSALHSARARPWFKYEPVASECRELGQRMERQQPCKLSRMF